MCCELDDDEDDFPEDEKMFRLLSNWRARFVVEWEVESPEWCFELEDFRRLLDFFDDDDDGCNVNALPWAFSGEMGTGRAGLECNKLVMDLLVADDTSGIGGVCNIIRRCAAAA